MARYTGLFKVATATSKVPYYLTQVLTACNFDVIYHTNDYLMAREKPGQVEFQKLVTVEVLLDKTTLTETQVDMSFVVKNEELPLVLDNHCRKVFEQVSEAVISSSNWKMIDAIAR
jgi:hypothetical protein